MYANKQRTLLGGVLVSLLFGAAAFGQPLQEDSGTPAGDSTFDWRGNDTCAVCHEESKYTHRYPQIEVGSADIDSTVHAQFACVDCHYGGFDDYPHDKLVHRVDCAECHEEQRNEYETSEHFRARTEGNLEAPACTDCHGFHDIQDPRAQLGGQAAIATCSKCHADEALTTKFKLKSTVLAGYSSSYHGEMYRLGFEGDSYATCVSCHDNHAVKGKDDPDSTISTANIVQTCATCHEDADANFASYLTHWSPGDGQNTVLDKAFLGLEALIWGVMIFFGIHTLLWFLRTLLSSGQIGSTPPSSPAAATKTVRRFSTIQRAMHLILILCFLSLALTGLPVKFSDAGMSQWIAQHLVGFHTAALIHRIAGVTLVVLFVGHILHVLLRAFAKKEKGMFWGPNSMVPNGKDFRDFFEHIAYFLFLRKKAPRFDRWTYWEKFDYFAVFWGMVIIGFSGLALMLPHGATSLFPGWSLNLAQLVHSEEALLATAFIFTVHFFNTHLRPNAFPMDDVVFTGHMTLERLELERPVEYERLKASGQLEALMVEPLAPGKIVLYRLGGLLFLAIGLALLVLILFGLGGGAA